MDVVTVTCYDTKNRDQRPNENLFYQFNPNYRVTIQVSDLG